MVLHALAFHPFSLETAWTHRDETQGVGVSELVEGSICVSWRSWKTLAWEETLLGGEKPAERVRERQKGTAGLQVDPISLRDLRTLWWEVA